MIKISRISKITFAALFIALNILLTRLVGLVQVGPLFSWARIAPGVSIVLFASIILGPFYGALVGVAGDALGWVMLGQFTGTFNFFLSIFYALMGVLPYFVAKALLRLRSVKVKLCIFSILGVGLLGAGIASIYLSSGIGNIINAVGGDPNIVRLILTIVVVTIFLVSLVGCFLTVYRYQKKQVVLLARLSPIDCFDVALSYELIAAFLKPLAFIAFYFLILGSPLEVATGVDYSTLLLLTLIFGCVNIPINGFLLLLYCRYGNGLIRRGGYEE